jgi:hypothetical protein
MRAAQAAQQQQLETTREASEISRNFAQAQATMNNVNNPNQKKE